MYCNCYAILSVTHYYYVFEILELLNIICVLLLIIPYALFLIIYSIIPFKII